MSRVEATQCDACGAKYADEDIYLRMVRINIAGNVHRHELDLCKIPCWLKMLDCLGLKDTDEDALTGRPK